MKTDLEHEVAALQKRLAKIEVLLGAEENEGDPIAFPSMRLIMRETSIFYGISLLDLRSHRRTKEVVGPRHVVMYLARVLTPASFATVGRCLGGRDHTTILAGWRKVKNDITTDEKLNREVAHVRKLIMDEFDIGRRQIAA